MKKVKSFLAIGCLSILLLAGMNVATACEPSEGLTPGYWKNHTDDWVEYSPEQTLISVFPFLPDDFEQKDKTLLEALSFKGGKDLNAAIRLLMKQAVAALLNIAHPDITYEIDLNNPEWGLLYFTERVLTNYGGTDREYILSFKDALDEWNNYGVS